jgi:hypothetical protein
MHGPNVSPTISANASNLRRWTDYTSNHQFQRVAAVIWSDSRRVALARCQSKGSSQLYSTSPQTRSPERCVEDATGCLAATDAKTTVMLSLSAKRKNWGFTKQFLYRYTRQLETDVSIESLVRGTVCYATYIIYSFVNTRSCNGTSNKY